MFNTVRRNDADHPVRQLQPHSLLRAAPPRPRADAVAAAGVVTAASRLEPPTVRSSPTSTAAPAAIPGPAGYGVRIEQPDGTLVEEFGESIGIATNNVAEYRGAARGARVGARARRAERARALRFAAARPADARQLQGEATPACSRCTRRRALLAHEIGRVTFEHVGRDARTRTPIGSPTRAMDDAA